MKKVLFLIGGAVLLFLFSFYCSYSIYKNSRGCNDTTKGQSNIEEYIWTIDRTDSEETTDAVDRVETVETISKKENSETDRKENCDRGSDHHTTSNSGYFRNVGNWEKFSFWR